MTLKAALTHVHELDPGAFCSLCSRDFLKRKIYTDHYRAIHAVFYVLCDGACDLFPSLDQRKPTLFVGYEVLLERGKDRKIRCHLCNKVCGVKSSGIKNHYLTDHHLAVNPSSKSRLPRPRSGTKDVHMDDEDENDEDENDEDEDEDDKEDGGGAMDIDVLPPSNLSPFAVEKSGPPPEQDEDWETDSSVSDTSTEVLIEEDEDDVVPPSFSFHIQDRPLSDDHPPSEQLPELPQEERAVSSGAVYGSESMYLC